MVNQKLLKRYGKLRCHLREKLRHKIAAMEGGEYRSETLRAIFKEHYGVDVGMYTHGHAFDPYMMDPHTTIGRYCSIALGVRVINHNHPGGFKSTSPLFFNPVFGLCKESLVGFNPLVIGNDVWIGANAIILPEVNRIGDGAIIGAGAVVNKDVPPYAVVLGNPGRIVKYRFSEDTIKALLEERWWEKDIEELGPRIAEFQRPLEAAAAASGAD